MGDPKPKSKKQSSGKSGNQSKKRPKRFAFYLDEDSDCDEVKEALHRHGVRYRSYCEDVPPHSGTHDETLYPEIAKRSCVYITQDYHQRYRMAERQKMIHYGIRHIVIPGNLGGNARAALLIRAKNNIFKFARDHEAPFSADVDNKGRVHLRMDRYGLTHEQKKKK